MNVFSDLISLILLLALAVNLGLSVFVSFKERKSEVNRSFSGLLMATAFWILMMLLYLRARTPAEALFLRRLTPIGTAFLLSYLLYFVLVFPSRDQPFSSLAKWLLFLPAVFFSLASVLTNWLIKGLNFSLSRPLYLGRPVFGAGYQLYSWYLIGLLLASVAVLARKYWDARGVDRRQLGYILSGAVLTGLAALLSSLVLPLLGFSDFFAVGPAFTLIMTGFIVYAIARYRLFNVTNVLRRGLLSLVLSISLIITLLLIVFRFDLANLISFWAFMANLTLAGYVYFYNSQNRINRTFCALVMATAFWILGIMMFRNYSLVDPLTYFWAKEFYVSGTLIFVLMVSFIYYFPSEKPKFTGAAKTILTAITLLNLVIICFTPWLVKTIVMRPFGPEVVLGWYYSYFTITFVLVMGFAFYLVIRKLLAATSVNRLQLNYVLLGMLLPCLFGVTFNLILPLLGNYRLIWIGPNLSIIFVIFTTYAIVRHRLMSIEMIVQRGVVYTAVTVIIMAFYALAVIISETFLRQVFGYSSLLVTAGAAMIIAILYQPLVGSFQSLTDRLFFKDRYDYQKTLRDISHRIASVIKLEELTRLIVSSFIDIMKVAEISFLVREKDGEHFRAVSLPVSRYKKIEIDLHSPIISWLAATKDILVKEEIDDELTRQENQDKAGLREVRDEMERLGISVWVPIITKEELIGVIALGHKLSGDIYSSEDIGLLGTLADQAAVALENARLYDEVVNMKDYNEEILQSMVSGVLTADSRGRIVTFNSMAEKISGLKSAQVLGRAAEEIWGRRSAVALVIDNSLKDRCYNNFEAALVAPEKGPVPVSFSSTLLKDAQSKKMGVLVTLLDLSEVKELEEKVRRADKLGALATMAAGMAHEIKNPLSSMKVLSQLLPKKFDDPEFRAKLQEIFPREIDRIDRIVESLLGFARATALTFEKIDLNQLLEETVKYFLDQARGNEVKLTAEYTELPLVEVDKGQISQVFSNLILNAIQALPGGGEIKVTTFPGKTVDGVVQDVKIRVTDTGHGIPEEQLKKLFDPFFTTKYGGTGLGLTISHNIVEGHRGYIDVESQVGKGTAFTVTLPVSQGLL